MEVVFITITSVKYSFRAALAAQYYCIIETELTFDNVRRNIVQYYFSLKLTE